MSEQMPAEFKTIDFNDVEFKGIILRAKDLIKKGYFTGINFLQSDSILPDSSVIVHFLHDSKKHLEAIENDISRDHLIVPRFTYYMLKSEYFEKPDFGEEYGTAMFFDSDFNNISIDEAVKNPHGVTISNKELDLIVPIAEIVNLGQILKDIREADRKNPKQWIDPVIIVKTKTPIKSLEGFVNKYFVSISHEREEFYCVITDRQRADALERYLDKLCERIQIGKLRRCDIVFSPSQINTEFADYLSTIQNQLRIVE
ncbi:MAG: hypothetical protein KAT43_05115 [Nanoarchaeota archaeon]|nr:hypothetical protein [Nanoarchaeota archaeon]